MTTTYTCPECAGPWLENYRFRHRRNCTIGHAQDRTRANDDLIGSRTRDATEAELTLAADVFGHARPEATFYDPMDPATYPTTTSRARTIVTHATTGLPRLVVDGFNPDTDLKKGPHA